MSGQTMRWGDWLVLVLIAFVVACGAFVAMAALISVAHAEPNYVANGRFAQRREGLGPINVPTGGYWYPEAWRITPGPGSAVAKLYNTPSTVSDGYGRVLYVKFTDYDPFVEPGRAWLEHHIFEYDELIGRTITVSWWQRVDGCCVGVVPMLMVNYHNGDYQFWTAEGTFLADQSDVAWPQQIAKDPAGYRETLRAAPYCLATTQWTECVLTFTLPDGAGHLTDQHRYIMLAMNFRSRTAPGIHMTRVRLEVQP